MNVRLLRRIAKVIQEKPQQFDMEYWHKGKLKDPDFWLDGGIGIEETLSAMEEPKSCGTTHCIAGWAQVLSREASPRARAENAARKVLGLTRGQARRLFLCDFWPDGFGFWEATPKQAAARIEHFIKTKGAE